MDKYSHLSLLQGEKKCKDRKKFFSKAGAKLAIRNMEEAKKKWDLKFTVIKCPFCECYHIMKKLENSELNDKIKELNSIPVQQEFLFVKHM